MPVSFPYEDRKSTQLNDDQASHTRVLIQASGEIEVWSRFTNSKRLDGDHFVTVVMVFDSQSRLLAVVKQLKGVNPTGFGKTVEVDDYTLGTISPDRVGSIEAVQIEHLQWDSINDGKFWEPVKKLGSALLEEFMRSGESGFRNT